MTAVSRVKGLNEISLAEFKMVALELECRE